MHPMEARLQNIMNRNWGRRKAISVVSFREAERDKPERENIRGVGPQERLDGCCASRRHYWDSKPTLHPSRDNSTKNPPRDASWARGGFFCPPNHDYANKRSWKV
eukprot:TRINITY_DN10561_c0_g1_i1.p2 TRINITY_DN10561_c0_g1~~TRINITY_DN10561_c0_g1_i1.p2  ORF type:complete len:105 (-),score=2.25 TRINITY_DN10561_c0_g1_i1:367-681(-)